jgi:hypothetical protein
MSPRQNAGQNHNLMTANESFENAARFKCLGTTATGKKYIHEEVKRELNSVNDWHHFVQNLLSF